MTSEQRIAELLELKSCLQDHIQGLGEILRKIEMELDKETRPAPPADYESHTTNWKPTYSKPSPRAQYRSLVVVGEDLS
jgi:hypothetical protein